MTAQEMQSKLDLIPMGAAARREVMALFLSTLPAPAKTAAQRMRECRARQRARVTPNVTERYEKRNASVTPNVTERYDERNASVTTNVTERYEKRNADSGGESKTVTTDVTERYDERNASVTFGVTQPPPSPPPPFSPTPPLSPAPTPAPGGGRARAHTREADPEAQAAQANSVPIPASLRVNGRGEAFAAMWREWCGYRTDRATTGPKSTRLPWTPRAAKNTLAEIERLATTCDFDPIIARLREAIASNWQGPNFSTMRAATSTPKRHFVSTVIEPSTSKNPWE